MNRFLNSSSKKERPFWPVRFEQAVAKSSRINGLQADTAIEILWTVRKLAVKQRRATVEH